MTKELSETKKRILVKKAEKYYSLNKDRIFDEMIKTRGAKVIDSDSLRKRFFEDGLGKSFKEIPDVEQFAIHDTASKFADDLFERAMDVPSRPTVIFTAGGSGSGKTEVLLKSDPLKLFDGYIVDGTLKTYTKARSKIDLALSKGKNPVVNYVLPDIKKSWRFVKERAIKDGRPVPDDVFLKAHIGSRDTVLKLIKDGITVRMIDARNANKIEAKSIMAKGKFLNSSDHAGEMFDILSKLDYNESSLRKLLNIGNNAKARSKTTKRASGVPKASQSKPAKVDGKPNARTEKRLKTDKPKSSVSKRSVKTRVRETTGQVKDKEQRLLKEKLKQQAKGARVAKSATKKQIKAEQKAVKEQRQFLAGIKKDVARGFDVERRKIRKQIGFQQHSKNLSGEVAKRLRKVSGTREMKNATKEQLEFILDEMKQLQKGDRFLTEKQIEGLTDYTKTFDKDPRLITQREIQERFKVADEVMNGFLTGKISNLFFPTVEIKRHNPVIRKVVDEADYELRLATKRAKEVNQKLEDLLHVAEKSAGSRALDFGKVKREVGERVFKKMSGVDIKLREDEQVVVDYLKEYFEKVRKDLGIERYRRNYITNIEKSVWEKMQVAMRKKDFDVVNFVKTLNNKKHDDLPIDIILALDNIIGSEKFFRFAMERKGGIDPTTNIRKILLQYSRMAEDKKALDAILPQGQAAYQLLLQKESAIWMRKTLQNLKGRGLDYKFRNGKMKYVAQVGDKIVNFGYVAMLGFNYTSALKNLVGGETVNFIVQGPAKFLSGKRRLLGSPKKAFRIISDSGILDGNYVEIVNQGIVSKMKKFSNWALYGGMTAAEYEIRGSFLLGNLTDLEWKYGRIGVIGERNGKPVMMKSSKDIFLKRIRPILDGMTDQGIYTKVDSPLFVQTTIGRSVMQFGRWKINNTLLIRRITKGAKAEWKQGNYNGKFGQQLARMIMIYSAGTFTAYQLGQAGMEEAKKIAESSTEIVDTIVNLPQEFLNAITANPTFTFFDSLAYTTQQLTHYIGLTDEPDKMKFRHGIEDTYFAASKTFGFRKEKKKKGRASTLPTLPKPPKPPKAPKPPTP